MVSEIAKNKPAQIRSISKVAYACEKSRLKLSMIVLLQITDLPLSPDPLNPSQNRVETPVTNSCHADFFILDRSLVWTLQIGGHTAVKDKREVKQMRDNLIAIFIVTILALSVFGAINVTTAPTVDAARIGTKVNLWVHPVWYAYGGLIPTPYAKSVVQGSQAHLDIYISAANKKHPCSPTVTCRIDGRIIGTLTGPKPDRYFWPDGCGSGSVTPHTHFVLSGKETARLSLGVHHFTVSYPGNSVYAPSTLTVKFSVSKAPSKVPTSTPSSTAGPFVGSKNSDIYHYPKCPDALKIKPANLVTFTTLAKAKAAGYRPCLKCHPPS